MSDMVERVAKAIAAKKVQSLDWRDHMVTAEAAILAMCEYIAEGEANVEDQVPAKEANQGVA